MASFDRRMPRAPRDGTEILVLVCTGDAETPIAREVAFGLGQWEGDWRYYDGEGGYSRAEPIGFALLPEIDPEFIELLTRPVRKPAPPKKASKTAIEAAARAKSEPPEPEPAPTPVPLKPASARDAALAMEKPSAKSRRK
jgi:hypothetical protein